MRGIKKFFAFFFFLFLATSVYAVCTWWNPLTYLECLAPVGAFVAAPFQAFASDSDLLLLSGSPTYMEGHGQPLTGNVVLADYIVGIGNDVAAIGSYDEERTTISALGDTATYFVTAKKTKADTIVKIGGLQKTLRNINEFQLSGTDAGYSVGGFWTETEVQQSIKDSAGRAAYETCKRELGSNYAAVAWRPADLVDIVPSPIFYEYHSVCSVIPVLGYCSTGWIPVVYFRCYDFGASQISFQEFLSKTANVQVDVTLKNNVNQQTSTLILAQGDCGSNCRTEGYFTEGGQTVGYAKITGLIGSFELPLDLTNESPAIHNGQRMIVSNSEAREAWNKLRALQEEPQFTNWLGNYSAVEQAATAYQTAFIAVYISRSTKFKDKWDFYYSSGMDSYIVNEAYTTNPTLQTIVLGEWIGLIRDVADFSISCGDNVSGLEQETLYSSVTVTNTSTVTGALTVSWSCPAGNNSIMTTIAAGQSKTFDIPLVLSYPASGSCIVRATWAGNERTCGIAYNFVARPEDCGDGVCSAALGENCVNCEQDCGCDASAGYYCENDSTSIYFGQCIGIVPPPPPPPPPPPFNLWWILVAVLLVAGIALVGYGYYYG